MRVVIQRVREAHVTVAGFWSASSNGTKALRR